MATTVKKIQQYKTEAVTKLKADFAKTPDLILSDFRGLTFPQMIDLRAKLGEQGTLYKVVRNAFARIAMKEAGLPDVSAMLEGPTALAFLGKDPSPAAKILVDFTKSAPLTIKGGVVSGKVFSAKEIEALSRLPGRLQLLAILLGTMNAPVRNMMYVMNGVSSKLVRTLAAVADKKKTEDAA
ncbi:MAG: 50S ribosomal protein L10 [Spirochaetia bacterium]